jgi:GNAT superfamily N-acetyltransferase
MTTTTVRRATVEDAETLAEVSATTFHDTFAEVNRPEDMDDYMSTAFTVERQREELSDPGATFFLALVDRDVAGYAKVLDGDAPDCVTGERPVELARMYARSAFHGKGVAAALMRACLDEARARGGRTIWLGVWEHNTRAIKFYEKCGFAVCGRKIFQLGSDPQTDLVMAMAL